MNKKLKLKIILTNIRRVIMSVLFVNLAFMNKVFAGRFAKEFMEQGPTCYALGPEPVEPVFTIKHVFIGLVPVVLVLGIVICIVKKHKNKSKKEENNDKQD